MTPAIPRTTTTTSRAFRSAPGPRRGVTDHGLIVDQAGRTPRMIDSLAADEQGRVYSVGSWRINPGDQPTLQYDWEKPLKEFKVTRRGQFFACFDPVFYSSLDATIGRASLVVLSMYVPRVALAGGQVLQVNLRARRGAKSRTCSVFAGSWMISFLNTSG